MDASPQISHDPEVDHYTVPVSLPGNGDCVASIQKINNFPSGVMMCTLSPVAVMGQSAIWAWGVSSNGARNLQLTKYAPYLIEYHLHHGKEQLDLLKLY